MSRSQSRNLNPEISAAQGVRLLDLRRRLGPLGGEIVEVRGAAGFVGVTVRGGELRRDGGDTELLVLPDGATHPGVAAVPGGDSIAWEAIEQAAAGQDR